MEKLDAPWPDVYHADGWLVYAQGELEAETAAKSAAKTRTRSQNTASCGGASAAPGVDLHGSSAEQSKKDLGAMHVALEQAVGNLSETVLDLRSEMEAQCSIQS